MMAEEEKKVKELPEKTEDVPDKGEAPTEGVEKGKEDKAVKAAAPEKPQKGEKQPKAGKEPERGNETKGKPKKEAAKPKKSESSVDASGATPAQVVKVFRKVGLYGECYQVLVRVLEGRDKGNLLRRNVRGPVKENDLLMLKETERDVRAV